LLLFSNPLIQLNGVDHEMEIWKSIHPDTKKYQEKIESLYAEREQLKSYMILSLQDKITEIKKKVIEIRETNRFSVPKYIANRYPVIFNINIFSFIKTVADYKNTTISSLKNIKNEIRYLSQRPELTDDQKVRIKELYVRKLEIMQELFALSSTHNLIDIMFQQEIKNHQSFKRYFYLFYLHQFVNMFIKTDRFLPTDYKNPYDCGYFDTRQQKSLLRKILNT
jgi:hypothetical protein